MEFVLVFVAALAVVAVYPFALYYFDKNRKGFAPLVVTFVGGPAAAVFAGVALPFALIGHLGMGESIVAGIVLMYVVPPALFVAALICMPIIYGGAKRALGNPVKLAAYVFLPMLGVWYFASFHNYMRHSEFSLHGKVVNYKTGDPLQGIKVTVHDLSGLGVQQFDSTAMFVFETDEYGRFHVDGYGDNVSVQIRNQEGYLVLNGSEDKWKNDYEVQHYSRNCNLDILKKQSLRENWLSNHQAAQYTEKEPLIVSACVISEGEPPGLFELYGIKSE